MIEEFNGYESPLNEYLYRYTEEYEGDEDGITGIHLRKTRFPVVKLTPKGKWIMVWGSHVHGRKKFVLNHSGKRFAYENDEDALRGYYFRKLRQVRILKSQLKYAEQAFNQAEAHLTALKEKKNVAV